MPIFNWLKKIGMLIPSRNARILSSILMLSCLLWADLGRATIFYAEPEFGAITPLSSDDEIDLGVIGAIGGLKIGWQVDYVHIVIPFHYTYLPGDNSDFTEFGYGIGLGWEWNWPLMTTIYLGGISEWEASGSDASVGGDGSQIGISISYFFSESFKLNLGWLNGTYNVDEVDVSARGNLISITASIPLEIPYPETWWRSRIEE